MSNDIHYVLPYGESADEDMKILQSVIVRPKRGDLASRIGREGMYTGVIHDQKHHLAVATDGKIIIASANAYDPTLSGKCVPKKGDAFDLSDFALNLIFTCLVRYDAGETFSVIRELSEDGNAYLQHVSQSLDDFLAKNGETYDKYKTCCINVCPNKLNNQGVFIQMEYVDRLTKIGGTLKANKNGLYLYVGPFMVGRAMPRLCSVDSDVLACAIDNDGNDIPFLWQR